MEIIGDVHERTFLHWATPRFMEAANNAANVEFTTTPTESWYWKNKLASREWVTPKPSTEAGDLGEVLLHARYSMEVLKELVFEDVRAADFSERPSRRRAMFLFDANVEPLAYAAAMGLTTQYLFEVKVIRGRLHRASLKALDCNLSLHAGLVRSAHTYWGDVPAPGIESEVLFEGECVMRWVPPNAAV